MKRHFLSLVAAFVASALCLAPAIAADLTQISPHAIA